MTLNFGNLFPNRPEFFVNYNFTDFSSNVGYVLYDGMGLSIDGGTQYLLFPSSNASSFVGSADYFGSATETSSGTISGDTEQKVIDIDFDSSEFKIPRTIEGTALFRCGIGLNSSANGDSAYIIIKLRKWDGSTETEIASVQSETVTISGSTPKEYSFTLSTEITTRTIIKKDEQLRITVEVWTTNFDTDNVLFPHRADDGEISTTPTLSSGNTRFISAIPFEVIT